METLFKLTPISEVDLTTLPNNEDYYCEVWVIDDETPIGEPTEKSPIVLRFKDGIFIDEDRETRWEPFEIASILLPVSEKQIEENERILCAAIHYDDEVSYIHQPKNIKTGLVFCGRRHHNIINTNALAFEESVNGKETQGFITNLDRFVNRKEAGEIAFKAGQIKKPTLTLYSEDLY